MKRLILFPFLLSAFSFMLITGCDPNMDCCITSVLTTSPATLSFLGSGGSQTIDLSSPMAWKIVKPSNFPSWITVTPESGNGSTNITITIAPNLNDQSRSYPLFFLAANGDNGQVTVNQSGNIAITEVVVTPNAVSLAVGATQQLTFTLQPVDATDKSVTWSSSDSDVATVDGDGLVTAVAPGIATITITTVDGGKTDQCMVTVKTPTPPTILELIGVNLVSIPGGTFTMGSPESEPLRVDNEDEHDVTLSGFYLSEYAITNAQYCEFLNALGVPSDGKWPVTGFGEQILVSTSSSFPWGVVYVSGKWQPQSGYANYPVIYVSWFGAYAFCEWAGGRLPTEAEWEYACRAGTETAYNTGMALSTTQANFGNPASGSTKAVGSYDPNDWGFYQMHGNVREWCSDWYDTDYYAVSPSNDPQGPASDTGNRVLRGGSWNGNLGVCRSAYRGYNPPDFRGNYNGFRIAVSLIVIVFT